MAKNVLTSPGISSALVILGWIAFLLGAFVKNSFPIGSTILLAIARVLP